MENLITIKEFATKAGVTHQAIYDLIAKKRLPSEKKFEKRLIDLDNADVKEYLITNKGEN